MLRSLVFIAASVVLVDAGAAQQAQNSPQAERAREDSKLKTTFGVTGPTLGHSPVNANGTPVSEKGVTTNIDGKPVSNLSGGVNVNPYTGVPVGQPLQPNDLGGAEHAPR